MLERAAVERDVALLRTLFEALHPGLYRYLTPAELDRAEAALLAELGPRPTLASAYLAFSRFTARLRCGHTFLNPNNQSDEVQRALLDGPRVPFAFRWLDGRPVVTRALVADLDLGPGDVVERIGEVDTAALLAELLPLARADGGNDAKRIDNLGLLADGSLEAFDILLGLLHPTLASPYRLTVRKPDGRAVTVLAPAMSQAEREALAAAAGTPDTGGGPLWTLTTAAPGVGYLRMPTWVAYKTSWDWQADLDRLAGELVTTKAHALIVDLRGNEGGSDVGDRLLRHVITAPLTLGALERRVRYRSVPPELRAPLDTWDPSFFDWGDDATELGGGFFHLAGEAAAEELQPLAPRFAGKLVVLVDAANSSATFQFAQHVQRYRLGTLIGEPTGGNQRGINGGAFFFVRLPGSGLEVDLPLIGRFPAGVDASTVPDAGLTPDVVVRTTAADLATGRDPQLAAALALVAAGP